MTLHYYSMIMSLVGELSEGRKSLSSPAHPSFSKHWLRNLPKQALWAFRVHKPNKQENLVARNSILNECWSMDAMSEMSLGWGHRGWDNAESWNAEVFLHASPGLAHVSSLVSVWQGMSDEWMNERMNEQLWTCDTSSWGEGGLEIPRDEGLEINHLTSATMRRNH